MPDFAANLSTMFTELPFGRRFEAAARCGFAAAEMAFPYSVPAQELARLRRDSGLALVAFNLPAGTGPCGGGGIACDPRRVEEFRDGVRQAVDYAATVNCRFLNCIAGALPDGTTAEAARQTLLDNLEFATRQARAASIIILVEPVDSATLPLSFVPSTGDAVALLDMLATRNIALLCDICHMHAAGEPVAANLRRHLPRIGHIQIAGWPGRGEPGSGDIDYQPLLTLIDRIGYRGWIGCEYLPSADTEAGLAWMARHTALTPATPSRWGIPVHALRRPQLAAASH